MRCREHLESGGLDVCVGGRGIKEEARRSGRGVEEGMAMREGVAVGQGGAVRSSAE